MVRLLKKGDLDEDVLVLTMDEKMDVEFVTNSMIHDRKLRASIKRVEIDGDEFHHINSRLEAKLFKAAIRLPKLEHLTIRDCEYLPTQLLLNPLSRYAPRVKSLTMENVSLDCDYESSSVHEFVVALGQKRLRSFSAKNIEFTCVDKEDHTNETIVSDIFSAVLVSPKLEQFETDKPLGRPLWKLAAQSTSLREIRVGFGVHAMAKAIQESGSRCHLTAVEVQCELEAKGGLAVAKMLRINKSLRSLSFGNFNKEEDGLGSIAEVMETENFTLERFKLISDDEHGDDDNNRKRKRNSDERDALTVINMATNLNRLGRHRFLKETATPAEWVEVLAKANADCDITSLYYFLQRNPRLCDVQGNAAVEP